jgi:RNA polymerase sigma-70 factor (ECF subfamily)
VPAGGAAGSRPGRASGSGSSPIEFDELDLERTDARASRLLESLPEPERDAVRARIVEERSYGEIAAELQCSELVVRKRVSRGLARMREQMKET